MKIKKEITNTWLTIGKPTILTIEITYSWWIFKFRTYPNKKIPERIKSLTATEISYIAQTLFEE